MGQRRKARELAVQFLYQIDTTGDELASAVEKFKSGFGLPEEGAAFFEQLVHGVVSRRSELDELIQRYSRNWRLERMSKVDRNILRLAVYEIVCLSDIPAKVSINEAIELGKRFGTEESSSFINGVLDAIRVSLDKEGEACAS